MRSRGPNPGAPGPLIQGSTPPRRAEDLGVVRLSFIAAGDADADLGEDTLEDVGSVVLGTHPFFQQLVRGSLIPGDVFGHVGVKVSGRLHALQQALLDVGAFQCAYCASGMIMSGVALLAKNPQPSEAQIVQFMDGNICRCGAYGRIVDAIKLAAKRGTREGAQ